MRKFVFLTMLAGLAAAIACGDPVPLQEMTAAKSGISKANRVMAEKYAADEYKASIDLLLEAHSLVRDEKYDDAASKAVLSGNKADEAYNKAAPLMAADALSVAEASISSADEAFASELAKDEFEDAKSKYEKAKKENEAKQFEESYASSLAADSAAKNARNSAISRKGMLTDQVAEVKATLKEAKKYNAETLAKEKYDLAVENLSNAEKSLEDLKLKEGFAFADEAKTNADEAYQQALKETALDKIQQAKDSVAVAESSKGAAVSSADMNASKEMLASAEKLFNESLYLDSIDASNESLRLSGLVVDSGNDAGKYSKTEDDSDVSVDDAAAKDNSSVVKTEPQEETDYTMYKVKWFEAGQKDCLWRIAGKFYNNPRKWTIIYDANRDVIKNPNWIYPGWMLKIPKK